MIGETFAKIALTGVNALDLVTDPHVASITFTCICGYNDNEATVKNFYICPNCQRIFMYSITLVVYDPNGVNE